MPVACMKSLMLAHEGWEFDSLALAKFRFINWFTFEYESQVNYSTRNQLNYQCDFPVRAAWPVIFFLCRV